MRLLCIRAGYDDMAEYACAALRLADQACTLLLEASTPLDIGMLSKKLETKKDILALILEDDYRLEKASADEWKLRLWVEHDRQSDRRLTPLVQQFFYFYAQPVQLTEVLADVLRWKPDLEPDSTKRLLHRYLTNRSEYIQFNSYWVMDAWLRDKWVLEPGFALREQRYVEEKSNSDETKAMKALVSTLQRVSPVPFSKLEWQVDFSVKGSRGPGYISLKQLGKELISHDVFVWLRNGHIALAERVSASIDWVSERSPSAVGAIQDQLHRAITERASDDPNTRLAIGDAVEKVILIAIDHLDQNAGGWVTIQELIEQARLRETLKETLGAHDSELFDEGIHRDQLVAQTERLLLRELRSTDKVLLSDGRVTRMRPDTASDIAKMLKEPLNGIAHEVLLFRLGLPKGIEPRALIQYLSKYELEFSAGYWHIHAPVVAEKFKHGLKQIRQSIRESKSPLTFEALVRKALPIAAHCPPPVLDVATAVAIECLERSTLWELESGHWWAKPRKLAKPALAGRLADELGKDPRNPAEKSTIFGTFWSGESLEK